jgi:tetratricopeptide (TPR) repeat protein
MESEGYRLQGNEEFKAGNFANAVEQYSKAIEVDPGNKTLFSNRSAAYLQLENYTEAVNDAQRCTVLDPSFAKGYFRLGCAFEKLNQKNDALATFLKALDITPHDQAILQKVSLLKKELGYSGRSQGPSSSSQSRQSGGSRGGGGGGNRRSGKDSWAIGLSPAEQHEWLTDCYRMRVDDNMHYSGEGSGLYSLDPNAEDAIEDFLVFCKLAVRNEVIPNGWDWKAFLKVAGHLLAYAFEKSDAQEKYGRENVFAAMMGGRSLRFTAEMVYESSCMPDSEVSPKEAEVHDAMLGSLDILFDDKPDFFDDVGGVGLWRGLEKRLQEEMIRAGYR